MGTEYASDSDVDSDGKGFLGGRAFDFAGQHRVGKGLVPVAIEDQTVVSVTDNNANKMGLGLDFMLLRDSVIFHAGKTWFCQFYPQL